MKILLSLPPNLVDCFHDITGLDRQKFFCTCDPIGHRLGSGGGTVWLLQQSCLNEELRSFMPADRAADCRRMPSRQDSDARTRVPLGARTATLADTARPAAAALREDDGGGARQHPHDGGQRRCADPHHAASAAGARCRRGVLRTVARRLDGQEPRRLRQQSPDANRTETDATETLGRDARRAAARPLLPDRHRRVDAQRPRRESC